ncbi:TMEM70 family [Phytophthora cactorum]|nr:TMEM70 family [Phytophthora cactorum]
MSRAVRLMKAVSVTSCTLTSIGMPVLCMLSEQDASTVGKWAMCGTIMLFGFGSTSLFHYLFKPYVMRMWLADVSADVSQAPTGDTKDDSTVTVETVSPPTQVMHPMVSFQARGRHYFIHPEAFNDQKLLNKLIGSGKRK